MKVPSRAADLAHARAPHPGCCRKSSPKSWPWPRTLRGEIKQLEVKIEQIRSDLARDLKDLEYRMTMKLTLVVPAVGAMATLVKLL